MVEELRGLLLSIHHSNKVNKVMDLISFCSLFNVSQQTTEKIKLARKQKNHLGQVAHTYELSMKENSTEFEVILGCVVRTFLKKIMLSK